MLIFTSVLDVQRWLNRWGARPPVAEDGAWGPQTEAALSAFARMNVLPFTAGTGYEVPTEAPLVGNSSVALLDRLYDRLRSAPRTSPPDPGPSLAPNLLVLAVIAGGAYMYWRAAGRGRSSMRGLKASLAGPRKRVWDSDAFYRKELTKLFKQHKAGKIDGARLQATVSAAVTEGFPQDELHKIRVATNHYPRAGIWR